MHLTLRDPNQSTYNTQIPMASPRPLNPIPLPLTLERAVPVPRNLALELPNPQTPNQPWPVLVPSKNLALELPGQAHC